MPKYDPVTGLLIAEPQNSAPPTNAYGDTQGMRLTPGGFWTLDAGRGTPEAPQSSPNGNAAMPAGLIAGALNGAAGATSTKPMGTWGDVAPAAGTGEFDGTQQTKPLGTGADFGGVQSTKPLAGAGPSGVPTFGGGPATPGTGIIGGALAATPGGAPGATPWNITADQTVAGQINTLTNPNNPLIVQARTRALQEANGRGIINSSLATSAADSAAYAAALPIAQADAAAYGKAAGYNADQINQMGLQTYLAKLQAETSRYGTDASAATSRYGADRSAETSRYSTDSSAETAKLNAETSKTIAGLNNEAQATANRLRNDNDKLLNTNSQAAAAFNGAMNAIANINLNDKMDAGSKTRAAAQVYAQLQSQLRVLGKTSGLDLTSTLTFANEPGFDAQGNFVGFNDDNSTVGRAPPPPPPAPVGPAPVTDQYGRPIGGNNEGGQ